MKNKQPAAVATAFGIASATMYISPSAEALVINLTSNITPSPLAHDSTCPASTCSPVPSRFVWRRRWKNLPVNAGAGWQGTSSCPSPLPLPAFTAPTSASGRTSAIVSLSTCLLNRMAASADVTWVEESRKTCNIQ